MGHFIIKLKDENTKKEYYLEWSSVVDAPITWGLTLKQLKQRIKKESGNEGLKELVDRLKRVEKTGTSCLGSTLDNHIFVNRAGSRGQHITKEQMIQKYCIDRR